MSNDTLREALERLAAKLRQRANDLRTGESGFGADPHNSRAALQDEIASEIEAALSAREGEGERPLDCVWIVEQNGGVHSVHGTHESAMAEKGENLRIGAPWQVLGAPRVAAMQD